MPRASRAASIVGRGGSAAGVVVVGALVAGVLVVIDRDQGEPLFRRPPRIDW